MEIARRWSSAVTAQREGAPERESLMVSLWKNGSDFDVTMWMTYPARWVVMSSGLWLVTRYCEGTRKTQLGVLSKSVGDHSTLR